MTDEVDATLAEVLQLSQQIADLPAGPTRAALEAQRDELRARARLRADATRPVATLEAELESVTAQLEAMTEVAIKPALNESYKMVTDPAAYRRRINESIADNAADRRRALERRRAELLEALEAQGDR